MATNTKIEKALYGPSLAEVALGAILGLVFGVVVAAVYLVFKPVETVKQLPKEISRSTIYFQPGSDSSTKGKTWSAKHKQFLAGAAFQVSEDELNAWATAGGTPPPPPKPAAKPADKGKPAKPAEAPKPEEKAAAADAAGFIIPSTPNFRVVGDKLQIGMKCTLNYFGLTHDVVVLTTGDFRKAGDQVVFVPVTVHFGSCPLHMLPAASNALANYLLSKQKFTDEMRLAWTKVGSVTIEGGLLKFAVQ
jgi:hypothetical protein